MRGDALRRSDELRSSGVDDGSTVQIMNMMRGGGKHMNKKNRAEKKPGRDQQEHVGKNRHPELRTRAKTARTE